MSRRKRQQNLTKEQLKWWSKEYNKALKLNKDALLEIVAYANTIDMLAAKKVEIIKKYFKES